MQSTSANISSRSYMVFLFFLLLGIVVLGKVFWLQISPDPRAMEIARSYTDRIREILPVRGKIYSTDGSLLATSVAEYDLRWDSKAPYDVEEYRSKIDSLCFKLSRFTGRSSDEFRKIFSNARQKGARYELIAENITYEEMQTLKTFPFLKRGPNKSGFFFERHDVRVRPQGGVARRTIGTADFSDGDTIKNGIELAYDSWLSGKKGKQLMEKIPGGLWRPSGNDYIEEPEEGCDVVATIDAHLQDVAHAALMKQCVQSNAAWGTVVLMEVETGYVRAIANLKRTGENGGYEDIENFAVTHRVEPGSTFKLASLMACLESGAISLEDTIATGNGRTTFHGVEMTDSNADKGGNGTITVEQVFEKSSNVGTALAVKKAFGSNPQKFLDYLHQFGLSLELGIDLQGEVKPRIYKSTRENGWSGLSITQMAIGYELLQTPLQVLSFYNAIANDGKMMRPQFVEEVQKNGIVVQRFDPIVIHENFCSEKTIEKARKMMEGVMEEGGTADWVYKNSSYKVAGKTGTAWLNEGDGYVHRRYRASFVGYFPANDPKYSCIVVINNPQGAYYGSAVAAPVFKELSDRICSTQLEFHTPVEERPVVVDQKGTIPVSKNGSSAQLATVFKGLNIPVAGNQSGEWVNTTSGEKEVNVQALQIQPGLVPNVKGMGLRDALHLLENMGLKVTAHGSGKVDHQSVAPGTPIKNAKYITITLS